MHHLIKKVQIVSPASEWHGSQVDVRLKGGFIAEIGTDLVAADARVWEQPGACLSPGWVDVGAFVEDPGLEHREELSSLAAAARAGGFTQLVIQPEAQPVRHDKSGILYVHSQSAGLPVKIHPLGALSRDLAGREISEMIDMHTAGAPAFSDGSHAVQHAGLLMRALLYVKTFGGLVINQPLDDTIAPGGQMHEGLMSTMLGMRGIPSLAEELMVERDLRLLAYTESRLHLANISTAGSVARIRAAKQAGLAVTASVPALNLLFTDEAIADFESNFKVMPPLRSETDRQALLAGLADGTLDWVSSNHHALEEEAKMLEFPYADFGAIGLQTCFGLICTATAGLMDLDALVDRMSLRPRHTLGLPPAAIAVGAPADCTLFQPDHSWALAVQDIRSKSKNTPLLGYSLTGRPIQSFWGNN